MKNLIARLFFFCSYIPFVRLGLESIYQKKLSQLKAQYSDHPELKDILVLSYLPDFIYGRSQFTILLVTKKSVHPKAFLNQFRDKLSERSLNRVIFNLAYIPVLSEKEFQLDILRGFLIRNSLRDTVKWKSLLREKDTISYLGKQNEFAIKYSSFQNISQYFLSLQPQSDFITMIKNIRRSVNNFKQYYPELIPELTYFNIQARRLHHYPFLRWFVANRFYKSCWQVLNFQESMVDLPHEKTPSVDSQLDFLKPLTELEFIDDIFVTPSLIQFNPESWQGKMYVDLILNEKYKGGLKKLKRLKEEISSQSSDHLKYRVRFTTKALFEISGQASLYPFPLEPLVRKKKGISIKGRKYPFLVDFEELTLANIHFLVTQFMRFRSLKQKNELIGSKFIKSLNLMYKYHLLAKFLEGEEFKLDHSLTEIRSFFTPQLSHLRVTDPVEASDWKIIEAQLKYLLKKIRLSLIRYDDSLFELRF